MIGLRRRISDNMSRAQRTIPDIAYVEEIDVTALEELRAHLNNTRREDQPKLTFIPFLVMALTRALPHTPQANAHFDGEAMVLTKYDAVHCGIAAATPNGLMVPVIKHAESLDIWQIASELGRLGQAAKKRQGNQGRADRFDHHHHLAGGDRRSGHHADPQCAGNRHHRRQQDADPAAV